MNSALKNTLTRILNRLGLYTTEQYLKHNERAAYVLPSNMPRAGTTEYGSWINAAKNKADMCFGYAGKDRFKWCCAFEQHLRKVL